MNITRLQHRELAGRGKRQANAKAWLDAFEYGYARRMVDTGQIVKVMGHEASNDGRGQVAVNVGVNATEVRVTERTRVADSHDARSSEERTSQRPTSERQHLEDMRRNHPVPTEHQNECVSYQCPVWYWEAMQGESARFDTFRANGRTFDVGSTERDAKTTKPRQSAVDHAGAYSALLAAVGASGDQS